MGLKLKIGEMGPLLDRAASQIAPETLQNLQAARRTALLRQKASKHSSVLAWIGQHSHIQHGSAHYSRSFSLGVAALVAIILFSGALYWQDAYEHDHSDVDIAILTDDLPVDMYVD